MRLTEVYHRAGILPRVKAALPYGHCIFMMPTTAQIKRALRRKNLPAAIKNRLYVIWLHRTRRTR